LIQDGGKSSTSAALNTLFSRSSFDQELLPEKYSFIIRYEELEESGAAIQQLHQGFESEGEQASSVHGYFSASGGAKALHAHTDPYDVFILQVNTFISKHTR
jgi:ribosomal protein L16 Arg81 hydroxylase